MIAVRLEQITDDHDSISLLPNQTVLVDQLHGDAYIATRKDGRTWDGSKFEHKGTEITETRTEEDLAALAAAGDLRDEGTRVIVPDGKEPR